MDKAAEIRSEADRLRAANRHIDNARKLIFEQEERIERLVRDGHNASEAVNLLQTLRESLVTMELHRNAIKAELARLTHKQYP